MDEKRTKRPLSELYVTARMVVLCLLVAFIVLFVAIGHSDMRAENFRYLIRYLDRSSFSATGEYSTVYYKGEAPSFVMYKGELAVLSDGVLTLYDSNGGVIMAADVPADAEFAARQSERYITVFSRSQGKLFVYNTFSSVFEAEFSGIYSVYAFDGGIAVVSAGDVYRTELTLFNGNFRKVYSLKTDNVISSLALSGSALCYAAVSSDVTAALSGESEFGEAGAFDTGTGEQIFKSALSGIPIAAYCRGERFYAATTRGIYIFSLNGEESVYYPAEIKDAFTDGGFAVTVNDGGADYLVFADGDSLCSCSCDSVRDVCFGEYVYVLSQSAVYRLSKSEIYRETGGVPTYAAYSVGVQVRSGGKALFALSDGRVLFCGGGSAFPLEFPDGEN
ncbi:MAG: hypothetical protein J5940_02485 [Clostridia bacterium]|nr:hypothetical protein [Clostridia bacterium]